MKAALATLLLLLAGLLPLEASAIDACTFDQARQARQLVKLAAHHPGGLIDKKDHSVTWHLRDGSSVTVGQGGCLDYGTTVRLRFAHGHEPSIEQAMPKLIAATHRFLPPVYANDITDAWTKHKFRRSVKDDGEIEFDADRDDRSLGFSLEIDLTPKDIRASWQEL